MILMKTKNEIRKKYKEFIKDRFSFFVCEDILDLLLGYKNIGIYLNIKNEISLDNIIDCINGDVYVPYMEDDGSSKIKNAIFKFNRYKDSECLDGFNIRSCLGESIDVNFLDVIICPGICFNKLGYRLGYGAACYDKILSDFEGIVIGVCFDDCIIEDLFQEEHDIRVDYIVSEKRVYRIKE